MKRLLKVLLVVFIFMMTLSTVEAASPKLNATSLTLQNVRSYTLKVKNTSKSVKWSSSNKKVATVSSKGKVSAVKNGTCTITAKVGSKKLKCKVTVKTKQYQSASTIAKLDCAKEATKIIIVNAKSTSSSSCIVQYFKKSNGEWSQVLKVNGYLGKKGIGKTKEGDYKTPTGLYHFTKVFGTASNPGTKMTYTKLTSSMYWCGTSKTYYNQFVNDSKNSDHKKNCSHSNDEQLSKYTTCYKYAAALDYNSEGTYNKGSAIFLHCKGSSSYTAGCIAVDKTTMKKLIKIIDEDTIIIIDKYSNIKNY